MSEVVEARITANGLEHHVITWNPNGTKTPFLLLHGFLDMAWSFRDVAEILAQQGHPVHAFDWRGHGQSEWIGKGGYYHFADYVMDLDLLVPQILNGAFHLVAHSMGGSAAVFWAATRPERVKSMTLAEGIGPDTHSADIAPDRMKAWLEGVQKTREKTLKPLKDYDEALQRMRVQNADLPEELGQFLVRQGTRPAPGGQGLMWSFDPLHRTTSPIPFRRDLFDAYLRRIQTPTQILSGSHGYKPQDEAERAALLINHERVEIANAGHMMHWTHPQLFAHHVSSFAARHD